MIADQFSTHTFLHGDRDLDFRLIAPLALCLFHDPEKPPPFTPPPVRRGPPPRKLIVRRTRRHRRRMHSRSRP